MGYNTHNTHISTAKTPLNEKDLRIKLNLKKGMINKKLKERTKNFQTF